MEDEIEALCGKIKLTEGEKKGIQITEGEVAINRESGGLCLVGKILSDRQVNKEGFTTILSRIWRLVGKVVFKELQDNMWLFEFLEGVDKERVMEGRPWTFDRQIIVLNEFDGRTPPSKMEFTHSPIWVQVHNMPLLCMNKSVGSKVWVRK